MHQKTKNALTSAQCVVLLQNLWFPKTKIGIGK